MPARLQKIIAEAGIASRRKAEEMILAGRVRVNGEIIRTLGSKADPARDHIRVDGRLLKGAAPTVHLLVNKPVGCVSSVRDPQGRPTVVSLARGVRQRIYPVGRLDYHSSGLMILTNDGELAQLLLSPRSGALRTYQVKLDGEPEAREVAQLEAGIVLDGRRTAPCRIRRVAGGEKPWLEITLAEGRYHQVRRMFERIGRRVLKLKRVRIAFLTDEGLATGQWRHLTTTEVSRLKDLCRLRRRDGEGRRT